MSTQKYASFALGAILGLACFQFLSVILRVVPPQVELVTVVGGPLLTIVSALGSRAWLPGGMRAHAVAAWIAFAVLALACLAIHEATWRSEVLALIGALGFFAYGCALAGLGATFDAEPLASTCWRGLLFGWAASWPCDEVCWRASDSFLVFPGVVFVSLLAATIPLRGLSNQEGGAPEGSPKRPLPTIAIGSGVALAASFGMASHYGHGLCVGIHYDRVHCSILTAFGIGVAVCAWLSDRALPQKVMISAARFALVWVAVIGLLMILAGEFEFEFASRVIATDWRTSWRNDIARGFMLFGAPSLIIGFLSGCIPRSDEPVASSRRDLVDDAVAFLASLILFVLPFSVVGGWFVGIPVLVICAVLRSYTRTRALGIAHRASA